MKKACMKCKSVNEEYTWKEDYTVANNVDTEKYLKEMVDNFNANLRPKESAREILEVWEESMGDAIEKIPHMWEKDNLVTQMSRGRTYDIYKCARCGITGKRFGLSGIVTRDSKYKAIKYSFCKGN